MRITWMAVLLLMAMATASLAEDGAITVAVTGNEDQVGAFVGVGVGSHTVLGLDLRWLDEDRNAPKGFSVGAAMWWTAVPEIEIPVGGLIPQWEIPGIPESVLAAIDLGGGIGAARRDETHPEVKAMAQIRLNPESPSNICVWFEHKFDKDLWSDLENPINQETVMLCLVHEFR